MAEMESAQDQLVQLQTPSSPATLAPCGVSRDGCHILCSSGSIAYVRRGFGHVELAIQSKRPGCCLSSHSTQQAAATVSAAVLLCTAGSGSDRHGCASPGRGQQALLPARMLSSAQPHHVAGQPNL